MAGFLERYTQTTQRPFDTGAQPLRSVNKTVLFIGSTGSGKSTLANYLLNKNVTKKNERFETSTNVKSTTTRPQKASVAETTIPGYSCVHLNLIDTPGLNEDPVRDLEHVIAITREVKRAGEIAACIFVVKFGTTIDAQYRQTVQYYSKLFGFLFEKNVFVVMTDYATDERSVAMRKEEQIDVDDIITSTKKQIADSHERLKLRNLNLFLLDCRPYGFEEKQRSAEVREAIFHYIAILDPIPIPGDMRVAKTLCILTEHGEKRKNLEGQIWLQKKINRV